MTTDHYEVHVNENAEEFCLAFTDKWVKLDGHAITIGKYQFSAVFIKDYVRISEVTSGAKVIDIPVPDEIQSFEETMFFMETIVVINLIQLIERANQKDPNRLEREIERYRQKSHELLGEKPHTEKIHMEFLTADVSDTLN